MIEITGTCYITTIIRVYRHSTATFNFYISLLYRCGDICSEDWKCFKWSLYCIMFLFCFCPEIVLVDDQLYNFDWLINKYVPAISYTLSKKNSFTFNMACGNLIFDITDSMKSGKLPGPFPLEWSKKIQRIIIVDIVRDI